MHHLLAVLALLMTATAAVADRPPNVLFIVADDLRAELGCYGSAALTPNIDALAKRGVRLERAYCQQAVCNPSRSSFLTGKRPDSLHLWSNSIHFRERNPEVMTMPQWFQKHGYHTRCVGKIFHNWHTKEKGDRRSWSADEFLHYANHGNDIPHVKGERPPNLALAIGRDYGKVPLCEKREVPDTAYFDGRVADEAVRVLREIQAKPFFLAVGFWKPHAPFNAPKKYWDLYDPQKLPPWRESRPQNGTAWAYHDSREILGIPPNAIVPNEAQKAEMRLGYFANISYMDAQVGKVLTALDELGLCDKTIIVFVSDHGYHIGEHELWGKTSCFEYDARVPLVISLPKQNKPGTASRGLVELIDLFPTLSDLAGLPKPSGVDGVSFAGLVREPSDAGKSAAFSQHPRPAYFDRTKTGIPEVMGYSVRIPNARYTEWRDWQTGKVVGSEFYDHTDDPHELRNRVDGSTSADLKAARAALHQEFPPNIAPCKR